LIRNWEQLRAKLGQLEEKMQQLLMYWEKVIVIRKFGVAQYKTADVVKIAGLLPGTIAQFINQTNIMDNLDYRKLFHQNAQCPGSRGFEKRTVRPGIEEVAYYLSVLQVSREEPEPAERFLRHSTGQDDRPYPGK
jgi:hypothetical protein